MLHPNLVAMDAESELTDKTRLLKMEPPDVIAQIMGLDLTNAASRVAFSESEKNAHHPLDLLDQTLWDEQQNEQQSDQPPVPEEKSNKKSNTEKSVTISNIIQLHRALKTGAEVLVGDDVWDAGSEFVSSGHTSPTENNSSETKLLLAALKREVLLLRNELNFELFLKQQHLQHIGRLHREHVLDSTVEAERQQLVKQLLT
jgi:hypothetical protein